MSAPHLRQRPLAELIADVLRERIVRGELSAGAAIPKQEELTAQFAVSMPSVREALRILQAEGLIGVRKGPRGGSVVQVPTPANVAYALALVLQLQSTPMSDVGVAIDGVEPLCAVLCALRADRAETVVPVLTELNTKALAALDDTVALTRHTREFHEHLVALCANNTLTLVAGALESVWSAQENRWASTPTARFPDRAARERAVAEHVRLTELIAGGDAPATWQAAAAHLSHRLYDGGDGLVDATRLRTTPPQPPARL